MSPEAKELLDYLLAFAGPGAVGGIVLALVGYLKARAERPPHIAGPSVGTSGLAQIGGMVMSQKSLDDLVQGINLLSAAHDRATLVREAHIASSQKLSRERYEQAADFEVRRRDDWRDLASEVRRLSERLRDARGST